MLEGGSRSTPYSTRGEQIRPRRLGRRARTHEPVHRRPQVGRLDRLGEEVVHAGREAALAILFPGARGRGDDGQVAPRRPFSLAQRLSDLEAVQFRHVDVE